jgi:hypothetical protein
VANFCGQNLGKGLRKKESKRKVEAKTASQRRRQKIGVPRDIYETMLRNLWECDQLR